MFELRRSENNRLPISVIADGKETTFTVYYKTPTTSMGIAFEAERVKHKKGKVKIDVINPAVKYGLEILTGVEDGVLTLDGQLVSTDPASPIYREDWKDVLRQMAVENLNVTRMLQAVSRAAFDSVSSGGMEAEFEQEGEGGEEIVPLQQK